MSALNWKRWPAAVLTVVVAMGLLGCPPEDEPDRDDLSVTVSNQDLEADEADTITIDEAVIDSDGFVVIYEDDDGQPAEDHIGASEMIEEGEHTDFEAELDEDLTDDQTLWAVLHYDDYADEFERPDKQPPVTDEDGDRVMDDFEVTVEDDVDPPPPDDELALTINDQTFEHDEDLVINVDEAIIDDDGFVVIYDDFDEDDEEGGDVLGVSDLLEDGTHTDFDIDIDNDAVDEGDTEQLYGVLHYDEDDDGEFDEDDDGFARDDGDIVWDDFEVTVLEEDEDPPEEEDSISVEDQVLDFADGDLSTIVNVDEITITEDGWVAILDDTCDDDGSVIGHESVDEGDHTDVTVELEEPAADDGDDRDLCAVLYGGDNNNDNNNDFDPDDFDELDDDDFNVEVTEGTAAVRITLDADDGPPEYVLEDVEPGLFDDHVDDDNGDLEFNFRSDWRYEIDNTAADEYPFEFVDDADEVLLSQEEEGTLEDDDSIDWVEDGDVFRFTVSDTFEDEVDGYQAFGQGNMTGSVSYQ